MLLVRYLLGTLVTSPTIMLLVRYLTIMLLVRYLLGTEDHYFTSPLSEDHYVTSPLSVRDRGVHYIMLLVRYLLGTEDHYVTSPLSVRDRGSLCY